MPAQPTFEQLLQDHSTMVFGMLVRLTGSREHVDDLAQEVFLRLHRALPSFRGESLLTTYLHRIIVNVAHDELKRRRRETARTATLPEDSTDWSNHLQHPGPNAEQALATRQLQARVEAELLKLSPPERAILVLYHQEERSYQQIAESLRLPIGTVRTHLHRGRSKLRAALQNKPAKEGATA